MLDFLRPMANTNCDCITFVENPNNKGNLQIKGQMYNEPGEKVGGSVMGDEYHIILFRDHKTDPELYDDVDCFDAVLIDPLEYMSNLIKGGWYGVIARKTTTSKNFIDRTLDLFKEMRYN
jgi:hypothetical protein